MGVPPGSVPGPTLCNILYNGVLGLWLANMAMSIIFADDLAAVVTRRNVVKLLHDGNENLKIISEWMGVNEQYRGAVVLKGNIMGMLGYLCQI